MTTTLAQAVAITDPEDQMVAVLTGTEMMTVIQDGVPKQTTTDAIAALSNSALAEQRATLTATMAGQAMFTTPGYTVGLINLYFLGTRLDPSEYTATDGTTITITNPQLLSLIQIGSTIDVEAAEGVSVANAVTPGELAAASGSAMVGFLQSGTSSNARTVQSKLWESVSAADFIGFDPTGATDSTAAIAEACSSLGSIGGTVVIPHGAKVLINENLTIPANVTLQGPYYFVGSPGNNSAAPYGSMTALILNPTATITLSSGSCIRGCLIYPTGMTFPQASSTSWTGTAITVGGDDASIFNCMILGFNKAVYSYGFQRPRIEYLLHDNINGIEIADALDVPYVSNCHAWPFATIATGGADADLQRSGIAYYLHDVADDGKLTNCFSYGYVTGFQVTNANTVQLISCTADNTNTANLPDNVGSQGFVISGTSQDTLLSACQASSMYQSGITLNTSAGMVTKILSCDVWNTNAGATGTASGITVMGGDVQIGCVLRNHSNGITVNNATSLVEILDETRFDTVSQIINATVATNNVFMKNPNFAATIPPGQQVVVGTVTAPTVASAASIALPMNGGDFFISGTTGFGTLYGGYMGRQVQLVFTGTISIYSSSGSIGAMRLQGGLTFNANANNVLTLRHNGMQWYEVGRA